MSDERTGKPGPDFEAWVAVVVCIVTVVILIIAAYVAERPDRQCAQVPRDPLCLDDGERS